MKKVMLFVLVALWMAPALPAAAQGNVFISKDVLKTADWASIKYKDLVKKATAGNAEALQKLFDFARYVDGVEALDHAVTCLEVIPLATDIKAAHVIVTLHPKLVKITLDRITIAQGRTKKEELKKPMHEWAPACWEALNGRPLPAPKYSKEELAEKMRGSMDTEPQQPAAPLKLTTKSGATSDRSRQ